jgi:hypothetical protein
MYRKVIRPEGIAMKLYVLRLDEYDAQNPIGVYSTKGLAETAQAKRAAADPMRNVYEGRYVDYYKIDLLKD